MTPVQPGEFLAGRRPHRWELARQLAPRWSLSLPGAQGYRLHPIMGSLLLAHVEGDAWPVSAEDPGQAGLEVWPHLELPPGRFHGGDVEAPLYLSEAGELYGWSPNRNPEPIHVGASLHGPTLVRVSGTEVVEHGLGDLALIDLQAGSERWHRRMSGAVLLAAARLVVAGDPLRRRLLAIETSTGDLAWEADIDIGVAPSVMALADEVLIATDDEHRLLAIDPTTGRLASEIRLPGRTPRGLLDPDLELHVLSGGFVYSRVAVRNRLHVTDELELSYAEYETHAGRPLLLADDGRLVFVDDRGAIGTLRAGIPAVVERLLPPDRVYRDIWPHESCLFALEVPFANGSGQSVLHCLGDDHTR